MRDEQVGKLRVEPGAYYKRLCICPQCGSGNTKMEAVTRGERRMACRRCALKFIAKEPPSSP